MLLLICLQGSFLPFAFSQEKWDLRRCVDYALANNISVKQTDIQSRLAAVDYKQNKWSQYPNVDFSTSTGLGFGRSIDPNTNTYISETAMLLSQNFGLSAGVTVFNWHRIRNNIMATRFAADAGNMDVAKVKNDIALNVATFYLQILLARQQVNIAKVQMAQTREQIGFARKKVDAGASPELDVLTLEGQYATDSSNYISAVATADQNLLDLKAVLNFDPGAAFDIAEPPVEQIPLEPLLDLQPENVFREGVSNMPAQKANALRIQAQEYNVKAAKGAFYPTISVGAGLNTQFGMSNKYALPQLTGRDVPTGTYWKNGTDTIPVVSPGYILQSQTRSFSKLWDGWGTLINDNFRQNIGVSISVPINNGGQARFNQQRAKLNLENAKLTRDQSDLTLKTEIYKAYNSASAALEKWNATKASVSLTQRTYDFASKRFELGLLNSFDLITSQNNLTRAKLDQAAAQFDYVFKMKVLEFYKGQGIKL